jgi:hypothetical protein
MKILKEFSDPEFAVKVAPKLWIGNPDPQDDWFWGLGDDGEIYFRSNRYYFQAPGGWFRMSTSHEVATSISLRDMKHLVKEFGHLLVWL